jgi:dipeptidyl aminopeptidase/acylaminoacyl peptidase
MVLFSVGERGPRADVGAKADPTKSKPAAKEKGKDDDSRNWTVDDIAAKDSATDFQISPDGRWCVWVKSSANEDKGEHVANLMRTDLKEGGDVELTRATESCVRPRWSPDGKRLAFLSARPSPKAKHKPKSSGRRLRAGDDDEPKQQLWVMSPFGGEPWALTDGSRGVVTYDWAGDDALVYAAQEEPTHRETDLKDEKKDDTQIVEDEPHEPPVRLFRVAVKDKKATRVTGNRDRVEQVAVSPDGRQVVTINSRSLRYTYDNRIKPTVMLHDLKTGESKRVFAAVEFNLVALYWAPDGKGFYAVNSFNSQPETNQAGVLEPHYYDLEKGNAAKVELDWPNGLANQGANDDLPGFVPLSDGFLALLANGARPKASRFVRAGDGWKREPLLGVGADHVHGLQASRNGKALVFAYSTASEPIEWRSARLEGAKFEEPKPIAVVNEDLESRTRARTEVVRWKGAGGDEVEGILYYPHDYKKDEKRPLIVMIHGGPASLDLDCWNDSWSYAPQLYCQRGAFVLMPNYHGSAGYGLKWLESITRGKYLDLETQDIEKGVDSLIERGLIDRDRLGLLGWSNGAILTNQLTTQTTRYKAAMSGAGNVEYVSDWASCDFGDAFDRYYLGKSPLEDPQLYIKKSPFYRLDKVRTPTLIQCGTEDRTVATQQSWVHYRALQQLAKTDVRFVLFPGEKHSLTKLAHRRRKLQEELAWFDKHLFRSTKKENEALKASSPLTWALGRQKAKRVEGKYGLLEKGVLIPETVTHEGVLLGRFEVTRAQYAAFDAAAKVDPGKENYPATGVSFEQAKAYCAWLTRTTGRTYRLPNEDEAEELYGKSEDGENTLNEWAGYKVNPDDAARLHEKIKELGGKAPLLREVGSGRGVGENEMVFDLGGNAAEWTTGADGKGVLKGGSADTPADDRNKGSAAGPDYRGFRVVLETAKQAKP